MAEEDDANAERRLQNRMSAESMRAEKKKRTADNIRGEERRMTRAHQLEVVRGERWW